MLSLATESRVLLDNVSHEILRSNEHKIMEAYGRIANNQIQDNGSISWIQSGLWYMTVSYNETDNRKDAYFYTDFKMVKPDGNSMHEHFIKNFKSMNVRIEEEKIIANGIVDVYSGKSLDYKGVPVIIDLRDNTVLRLAIDKYKTQQHFANEILGVLIESRYLGKLLS